MYQIGKCTAGFYRHLCIVHLHLDIQINDWQLNISNGKIPNKLLIYYSNTMSIVSLVDAFPRRTLSYLRIFFNIVVSQGWLFFVSLVFFEALSKAYCFFKAGWFLSLVLTEGWLFLKPGAFSRVFFVSLLFSEGLLLLKPCAFSRVVFSKSMTFSRLALSEAWRFLKGGFL